MNTNNSNSPYKNLDIMVLIAMDKAKSHNCNYIIMMNFDDDGEFGEHSTYEMVANSYFEKPRANAKLIYTTDNLKKALNLKPNDHIAFYWPYSEIEIMVASITCTTSDNSYVVHFMDGYKSESKIVSYKDVIAIGDYSSNGKIRGWSGNFDILQPNNKHLLENNE